MITNILATLTVTLLTNSVESLHPSGQEKTIINTVSERQVISYEFRGTTVSHTNEIYLREERFRRVVEWKDAPLKADTFNAQPPYPNSSYNR